MSFVFTSKHRAFIDRMLENSELERKGYELLLTKEYFPEMFDHLKDAGLFDASRLPGPLPGSEEGYVRIPYWEPLDYLEACVRYALDRKDESLSLKVLNVIREATLVENVGEPIHNYHTSRTFATILGFIPTAFISLEDLDLVSRWLQDPYDNGMVCRALDKGLLTNLLASQDSADWHKAAKLVSVCMELKVGRGNGQIQSVVDDYWLKGLLTAHLQDLGRKAGAEAASIFLDRLTIAFGKESREGSGNLFRPAIEDHPQNQDFHCTENRIIEGLRDVMLAWLDSGDKSAMVEISALLQHEIGIARRIAIHVIDERWESMKPLLIDNLSIWLFQSGHLHELYRLLSRHFNVFTAEEQKLVIEIIRELPLNEEIDDAESHRRFTQRRWLSAIQGKGNEVADNWFVALGEGPSAVGLSKYPDLHTYMESRWGDGDSLYQVEELLAFANSGQLIEVLNNFVQTDRWDGPSTRALVHTLELAVKQDPKLFFKILPEFHEAKRAYQYGAISGLRLALNEIKDNKDSKDLYFDWRSVLEFVIGVIDVDGFWTEVPDDGDNFIPNRDWIPSVIADLIRDASHGDNREYPRVLSAQILRVIEILLIHAPPNKEPSDDPMTAAINSPKGKAIEALFDYTRNECKYNAGKQVEVDARWGELYKLFDLELEKTQVNNFEFTTLAAAYILNLQYFSKSWLNDNVKKIFRIDSQSSLDAAIGGLAYSQPTKSIYELLDGAGVIDAAFDKYTGKSEFRDRLVERTALAYLWGKEDLDGKKLSSWFELGDLDALEAATGFFWHISREQLDDEHKVKILDFWRKSTDFGLSDSSSRARLLSSLSRLIVYLNSLDDSDTKIVMALARYVHVGYNSDRFIEELERLVKHSPAEVYKILSCLIEVDTPLFDFEDRLKSIMRTLYENNMKEESFLLVDKLRRIRGIPEFWDEIQN